MNYSRGSRPPRPTSASASKTSESSQAQPESPLPAFTEARAPGDEVEIDTAPAEPAHTSQILTHPVQPNAGISKNRKPENVGRKRENEEGMAPFERRLNERKTAKRQLWIWRTVVVVGVLALIGAVIYVVGWSPVFGLKQENVAIEGAQSGPQHEEVAATLQPYVGTPLVRIPVGAAAETLRELPFVSEATVTRSWPTGLLVVVDERLPAMISPQGGGFDVLGTDGVIIETVTAPVPGLPTVVLSSSDSEVRQTQAAEAYSIWINLEEILGEQVASIEVQGSDFTVNLVSGQQIIWGTADDSLLKARIAEILLSERGAPIYDVSDPSRPSTR